MNFELNKEYVDSLKKAIIAKDATSVSKELEVLHAADIAELYDELTFEETEYIYGLLAGEQAADVLMELSEENRQQFLKLLPNNVIANQYIHNMDSDDAADLIGELEETRQDEILALLEDVDQAGDIVDLLHYDEDTAGGLMAKEMMAVKEEWSMPTCMSEMRRLAEDIDEIYYIYVVNNGNILTGVLPLKKMLLSPSVSQVKNVMKESPIAVKTDTDKEEVAQIMEKYNLIALPVVDSIGRLVGRITIDDVVDVIREEAERDYQMASGISQDVESSDNILRITKARIPWLVIGLVGGIFSARIIGIFEGDLMFNPHLAFFIPMIAAMGGNAGIQSSAIVVQGLANNSAKQGSVLKRIFKEVGVALVNASILSILIFCYNFFFSGSHALTYSVSLSLFSIIIIASILGTAIPLLLNKINIDPALATGPFITTMNDIFGLFIYFGICSIFF